MKQGIDRMGVRERVRLLGVISAVALALSTSACALRPAADVLVPVDHAPHYTSKVTMLVATTRRRAMKPDPDGFTAEVANRLNYASLTISLPKSHEVGQIEWPDVAPGDPLRHFQTTQRVSLEQRAFLDEIRTRVQSGGAEAGEVLVFVHGYNTLYPEAVYRFAQIVHDTQFTGTAILFAWPSRGQTPLYLADREAAAYSRDYLERLLIEIAGVSSVREINILAHSMGAFVTVETLRQAAFRGHGTFSGKLGDVVLAAPDLDVNLFRSQVEAIGRLPRPMTVLVSSDDNALAFSKVLAGGIDRLGQVSISDPRVIQGAALHNIRVVDLSKVIAADSTNHSKFAQSPEVLTALGRALGSEKTRAEQSEGVAGIISGVGTSAVVFQRAVLDVVGSNK